RRKPHEQHDFLVIHPIADAHCGTAPNPDQFRLNSYDRFNNEGPNNTGMTRCLEISRLCSLGVGVFKLNLRNFFA
ncbi:MAG TPA: hypothetical protein PLD79_05905, partial [Halothiobacillus sp.]|nr:hypothetical protein [Halothiobacillus sp.]